MPAIEYWTGDAGKLADKVMTATVAVEPYETYRVAAFISIAKNTTDYANDATTAPVGVTLQVGEGTATTCTGTRVGETKFFEGTFETTGEADGNGNLTIKISTASTDASWVMFRDVKYTKQAAAEATAEEKAALLAAINTAKAHIIGFEENEYAPYNNKEALATLTTAETVYATSTTKPAVNGIKDALEAASWTKNTEELNTFYDGTFSTREVQETSKDGTKIPGWTSGNNIRQILKTLATFPGLTDATDNTALFVWSGGATYGSDPGFEMPLKADTYYRLNLKVAGWNKETRGNINVSVLNGSDGLASTNLGKADKDISAGMTTMTKVFKTGAAGNYIFSISSANNIVFTDVEIKKAVAEEITISEDWDYVPTASGFANVSLSRSIKDGTWNTIVLPFDLTNDELKATFGSDVEVAEYSESADGDNSTVNFNKMETPAIMANKPVLLKTATAGSSYVFNAKEVKTNTPVVEGEGHFDFVGTYDASTKLAAGTYYLSANNLYRCTGEYDTAIKGTRAYVSPKTPEAAVNSRVMTFFIYDDTTTQIVDLESGRVTSGKVFNLNGQEVKSGRKGLYIQNGKKVVLK